MLALLEGTSVQGHNNISKATTPESQWVGSWLWFGRSTHGLRKWPEHEGGRNSALSKVTNGHHVPAWTEAFEQNDNCMKLAAGIMIVTLQIYWMHGLERLFGD